MKYTIKNFKADFPDDKTCLAFIFKNRYPKGLACSKCERNSFVPVEGRRSYACACGYQIYPTGGTIFHKSPTPLTLWFHAIFLMSQSKNGVAAKELERQLGVTYKCAWRMAKQIRLLMGQDPDPLDEFSFRYNHRKSSQSLPVLMFSKVGTLLLKDEKIAS
jgi:transposase